MTLSGIPFAVREGNWFEGAKPWNPLGVSKLSGERMRLAITQLGGKWYSAGVTGPELKVGDEITIEVVGRLDAMDPRAVFAIWTYRDQDKYEVDILEATRWGDPNTSTHFRIGHWDWTLTNPNQIWGTLPARAYLRNRIVITRGTATVRASYLGLRPDGTWHHYWSHAMPMTGDDHILKLAQWLMADGFLYTSTARGPLSVDVTISIISTTPTPGPSAEGRG